MSTYRIGTPRDAHASRYVGSAALLAAIRAAADDAPESFPAWLSPLSRGAFDIGGWRAFDASTGDFETTRHGPVMPDDEPADWPRAYRLGFLYALPDGTRGEVRTGGTRRELHALADRIGGKPHTAALFDGKAKARKGAPRAATGGAALHVTAAEFLKSGDWSGALALAQASRGGAFFGRSDEGCGAVLYMGAERLTIAGHAFVIARRVESGAFFALHEGTACSGAQGSTASATRAAIEARAADAEEFAARLAGALAKFPAFDQSAAEARFLAAAPSLGDATEETAQDAPQARETAADVSAPAPAPENAPAARETAAPGIVARVVSSPAIEATRDRMRADASLAARRVEFAAMQSRRHARALLTADRDTWERAAFYWRERGAARREPGQALRDAVARRLRHERQTLRLPSLGGHAPADCRGAVYRAQCATFAKARELRDALRDDSLATAYGEDSAGLATFRAVRRFRTPAALALRSEVAWTIRRDRAAARALGAALPWASAADAPTPDRTMPGLDGAPPTALSQDAPPTAQSDTAPPTGQSDARDALLAAIHAGIAAIQRVRRTTGGGAWNLRAMAGDLTVAAPVYAELCRQRNKRRRDLSGLFEICNAADALALAMEEHGASEERIPVGEATELQPECIEPAPPPTPDYAFPSLFRVADPRSRIPPRFRPQATAGAYMHAPR